MLTTPNCDIILQLAISSFVSKERVIVSNKVRIKCFFGPKNFEISYKVPSAGDG